MFMKTTRFRKLATDAGIMEDPTGKKMVPRRQC